MIELLKNLLDLIIKLLKYILSKLIRFGKSIRLLLLRLVKWILRPKVRNSILGILTFCIPLSIERYNYYYPEFEIKFTAPLKSDNVFTSILNINNNGNCNLYDFIIMYKVSDFILIHKSGGKILSNGASIASSDPLPTQEIITPNRPKSIEFDLGRFITQGYWKPEDIVTYESKLTLNIFYKYWFKNDFEHEVIKFKTSKLIDGHIIWIND